MVLGYKTIKYAEKDVEITRSRFITRAYGINSEEQAFDILHGLRREFSDATHICHAFIADKEGNCCRFSDDGEPQGTAGLPILDALKRCGLRCVLVAVVRYFGGVKLGVGPLARAYGECALGVIKNAQITEYTLCNLFSTVLEFSVYKRAIKGLSDVARVMKTEFSDSVYLELAVRHGHSIDELISSLSSGKSTPQLINSGYYAISTNE